MSATRTQVYFTEEQRRRLDAIAAREDKSLAEVVREAVDSYLDNRPNGSAVNRALEAAAGTAPRIEVPARSE